MFDDDSYDVVLMVICLYDDLIKPPMGRNPLCETVYCAWNCFRIKALISSDWHIDAATRTNIISIIPVIGCILINNTTGSVQPYSWTQMQRVLLWLLGARHAIDICILDIAQNSPSWWCSTFRILAVLLWASLCCGRFMFIGSSEIAFNGYFMVN